MVQKPPPGTPGPGKKKKSKKRPGPEPEPARKHTLDKKAEARAFLGKKGLITVDGMKPMYGPGTGGGGGAAAGGAVRVKTGRISAAALASAALAQRAGFERPLSLDDDALVEFRTTGTWKAPSIYRALDGGAPEGRAGGKAGVPAGLLAAARARLGVALYGEVHGVRAWASTLARAAALGDGERRELDGISRAAGSRQLTTAHLKRLVPIALIAAGGEGVTASMGAASLVEQSEGARPLGSRDRSAATPKQIVELRPREACLVILDLPQREGSRSRAHQEFTLVVGLLRSSSGELVMVDPDGLFDPVRGTHDENVRYSVLHRAQEVGLTDYVGGVGVSPPQSPVARLVCNSYLSAATPRNLAKEEVPVVAGAAFRLF